MAKRESKIKAPSKKIRESTKVDEMVCYHCDKEIRNSSEVVFKPIERVSNGGKRAMINRMFHMKCLKDYVDKSTSIEFTRAEQSDWDKVYQCFKHDYMGGRNLTEHAVRRLLGLRLGKYYPQGNNTRILDRGYPFSTIYKAMLIAKFKAKAYASTIQFTDYNHEVNTYLKFIASEVVDMQMRIDRIEKDNQSLQKAVEKRESEGIQQVNYLEERLVDKVGVVEEESTTDGLDIFGLWGLDLDVDED